MHMVNDKGEAVYYNPVRKHNKDYWVVKGIGSTVVYGRDRERAKAALLPKNGRRSATLPGMVSSLTDRYFSSGKNNKGEHQHERITH